MVTEIPESALFVANVLYLIRNCVNSESMRSYNRLQLSLMLFYWTCYFQKMAWEKSPGISHFNSSVALQCGRWIYFRMATGELTSVSVLRCDEVYLMKEYLPMFCNTEHKKKYKISILRTLKCTHFIKAHIFQSAEGTYPLNEKNCI